MSMPLARHYTAADLATMPDDGLRYEIDLVKVFEFA
jgi:hypothetical protein